MNTELRRYVRDRANTKPMLMSEPLEQIHFSFRGQDQARGYLAETLRLMRTIRELQRDVRADAGRDTAMVDGSGAILCGLLAVPKTEMTT